MLRFTFERLRGFCEVCGRLTHDSGACLIQNGGINHDDDDEECDDENGGDPEIPNQGVIIEEVHDGEPNGEEAPMADDVQENIADVDAINNEELNDEEGPLCDQTIHTTINSHKPTANCVDGREMLKRKA